MKRTKKWALSFSFFLILISLNLKAQEIYHEQYRSQNHFSPKKHWTNDPNGMVYYKGIYHLFFQYYPDSTIWGPMHWGHATSKDLVHWEEQPIALYPDSLGYIFSGSAVVDYKNTSGFGKDGKVPLVAIFTHSDPKGASAGRNDFQNQSLAYSLDEGKTWTKYAGNPVLKNPGIVDFRDPKVMWYEPQKKWVMTLATKDRITFYSSLDLKNWTKETEFGKDKGAHGGVWECPDLFSLDYHGKKIWVLVVNLNPGGPNKGSATQYFTGHFDGHQFISNSDKTKWMDYGADEYAGITWSNTGNRKIFLGWMSNWMYANQVPSVVWRNAMTFPRELKLEQVGNEMYVASQPVKEISGIVENQSNKNKMDAGKPMDLSTMFEKFKVPSKLDFELGKLENFSITLSNDENEKLVIGFDKAANQYYIDRTLSGKVDFQKGFAAVHTAPRLSPDKKLKISILLDVSSIELFADDGLTTMTDIVFPSKPYNHIEFSKGLKVKNIKYVALKSIWL
ncbi:MAG: glycoside hydrolase family 32 protein [Bacteroidetes bacterium]|nr:glycoside hydrolase family 32 protein [Bacteroidota bacterium]